MFPGVCICPILPPILKNVSPHHRGDADERQKNTAEELSEALVELERERKEAHQLVILPKCISLQSTTG